MEELVMGKILEKSKDIHKLEIPLLNMLVDENILVNVNPFKLEREKAYNRRKKLKGNLKKEVNA